MVAEVWPLDVTVSGSLLVAVDPWAGLDPVGLSDVALADEVLALRRELGRLEGVFAWLVAAARAGSGRGGWCGVDRGVVAVAGGDA